MVEEARAEERRRMRLTERWTPLDDHPGQAQFFWHSSRFKINPSGRRSGKTELAKRKVARYLTQAGPPAKIFYAAPTFGQARAIYWQDLIDLIPRHWIARKREGSDLEIWTHWGAMVKVVGLDRPQRIEGIPWYPWVCLDEMADMPPRTFELNIRPALSTRGRECGADLIGVPDEVGRNQVEYEQLYETGLRWPEDPDVCSFHWPSSDILPPKEITALKRGNDPMAFEQEMGGRFVRSGGKAVPYFDKRFHASDPRWCEYCPWLPLDWSLDFGSNPACSLIGQTYKGHVWIMDEICITQNGSTEAQLEEFRARCIQRGYRVNHIRRYGDAAGRTHHSNTGRTDYEILDARMKDFKCVEALNLRHNPPIKDTVNVVRTLLRSASHEIRLHIHPRCERLINDLSTAPWPDDLGQFHCLAALRYYLYALFADRAVVGATAPLHLPNLGGRSRLPRARRF